MEYTRPDAPQIATTTPAGASVLQGALKIAETRSAAQKCTTLGLPNAAIASPRAGMEPAFAISVSTTNCSPVRAPADEPTITKKLPHSLRAVVPTSVTPFPPPRDRAS